MSRKSRSGNAAYPNHRACQLDKGRKVTHGLFIAGGNAPTSLDTVKATLHFVPQRILVFIHFSGRLAFRLIFDDNRHSLCLNRRNKFTRILAGISDACRAGSVFQQGFRHGHIVLLSRCDFDMKWHASKICQKMSFGGDPASRAAYSIFLCPFSAARILVCTNHTAVYQAPGFIVGNSQRL